jgi:hypothetical protein
VANASIDASTTIDDELSAAVDVFASKPENEDSEEDR